MKTLKNIKHTLTEIEDLKELLDFIKINNLKVSAEVDYDFDESGEVLLVGSFEDVKTIANWTIGEF